MSDLFVLDREFEGQSFQTFFYRGRPCWVARDVGRVLGYADDGRKLSTMVMKEWNGEFIENHDHLLLTGEELSEFKGVLEVATPRVSTYQVSAFTPRLLLLFEPGMYLVLAKTSKPIGQRLRRFIADEVMPQVARDGKFIPGRVVDGSRMTGEVDPELRKLELAEAKEARLDRKMKADAMKYLAKTLRSAGHVSKDVIVSYEIAVAEMATGKEYSSLKPKIGDDWKSPTAIADRFGVTSQRIGRVITDLGLRGNQPGLSRAIVNKARGHERTVTSYVYSPVAVDKIEEALMERGMIEGSQLTLMDSKPDNSSN